MDDPDWLGPATDLLKAHSLEEAAAWLAAEPATRAKFEEAIGLLESILAANVGERWFVPIPAYHGMLELIAEARGETTQQVRTRLIPPPPTPDPDTIYF